MKVNQQHQNRQPRGEIQREGRADAAASVRPGAGNERSSQRQSPQAAQAKVKDANAGREFQGTGVLNKAGRYGSSTSPEQLTDHDGTQSGGAQRKG